MLVNYIKETFYIELIQSNKRKNYQCTCKFAEVFE